MIFRQASSQYALAVSLYQALLLALLQIMNISVVCSHHVMLFLKIYIPAVVIGIFGIMFLVTRNNNKGNALAQV